jgi:hypothetical protein
LTCAARPSLFRRVRPQGKVNLIGVVMLAGITYAIWWIVTYSTVYLDNLDVKDAVNSAFNQSVRAADADLRQGIVRRLNFSPLGWHWEETDSGERVRKPGLGVPDEGIEIERDDVANTILVRVTYEREVELLPFDKLDMVKFVVEKQGKIPPP